MFLSLKRFVVLAALLCAATSVFAQTEEETLPTDGARLSPNAVVVEPSDVSPPLTIESTGVNTTPLVVQGFAGSNRLEIKDDDGAADKMILRMFDQAGTELVRLAGGPLFSWVGGNFGVGTANPLGTLTVASGAGLNPSFVFTDGDIAHGLTGRLFDTSGLFAVRNFSSTSGGAWMIGAGDDAATPGLTLQGIIGSTNPNDSVAALVLNGSRKNTTAEQALSATETVLQVETGAAGSGTKLLTILGNGNIGIGFPNPTFKLHVNGNTHIVGTLTGTSIQATYQDVAEWVPSTSDLAPGTVVVLNPDRNNEVMMSSTEYDTSVAGVVSAQPGLILGVAGAGKEQVATTGRVRVRVDATKQPIRVGDLLVTSSTPGMAKRSEPLEINGVRMHRPGTIIGKALEPLQSGEGEILVLLSMQ